MNQKFLDAEGVKHLWSKISMEDYPNNKTLMAVINAIDETKADKSELIQSDWNQIDESKFDFIKNRTHYSVTRDETITLSFDGNSEGMDVLESEDKTIRFVKVSDDTISIDDMRNASVNVLTKDGNDSVYDNLSPYINIIDDKTGSYMVSPFMIVTFGDIMNEGFGKIKKGTWFVLGDNNSHVKSLTYTTEVTEIHKLDPKYLPDGGVGYETTETTIGEVVLPETTLEWKVDDSVANSTNGNYWVPFVPTIDTEYIVTLNGVDYTIKAYEYQGLGVFGNVNASSESTTADIPFCGVWGTGDKMMFAIYYDGVEYKEPIAIKITEVTNTVVAHKIDPKFLPTGGFGYEDKYEGQLTYIFDGNPNNAIESVLLDGNDEMGYYYAKFSDNIPTIESVIGGTLSYIQEGQAITLEITEDMIFDASAEGIPAYIIGEFCMVVTESATIDGITLSAGIWTLCIFSNADGGLMYTSELSFYGTDNKVHKIDGKFLYQPDWNQNDETAPDYIKNRICYDSISEGLIELTFDGNLNNALGYIQISPYAHWVKISNATPSMESFFDGSVTICGGGEYETTTIPQDAFSDLSAIGENGYRIGGAIVVLMKDSSTTSEFTHGIWVMYNLDHNDTSKVTYVSKMSYRGVTGILKKLDPKYLPDGGFGYTEGQNGVETLTLLYSQLDSYESQFLDDQYLLKLSNDTPEAEAFIGYTAVYNTDQELTIADKNIVNASIDGAKVCSIVDDAQEQALILIAYEPFGGFTPGIWAFHSSLFQSVSYMQKEVVHKIDQKFLPYDIATDEEIIAMFMEKDMFPAVADADGSVLADENNNILLW